ncbi:hypothetical protein [Bathymodiolus platifrons methanotrophic gill symbiont]|uniref:hypothetical protein n=1 Tax=Bathymodiolus platifrons methanotrophic gill symbiont TaxID=113268 RepID=UPI001C8DE479|nr:hypothetical protein [Bathymodiolus platifrons methanotrophic gill symbiont]
MATTLRLLETIIPSGADSDSLSDKKKADIKAAKAYIVSDINPLLIAVGKLQETTANKKKITDLNK